MYMNSEYEEVDVLWHFDETSATSLQLTRQPTRQDWPPKQHFKEKQLQRGLC